MITDGGGLVRVVRIYLQLIPVQASVSWQTARLYSDFLRRSIQISPPTAEMSDINEHGHWLRRLLANFEGIRPNFAITPRCRMQLATTGNYND